MWFPCDIAVRLTIAFFIIATPAIAESSPVEVHTEFASDAVVTTVVHNAMGTTFRITLVGQTGEYTPEEFARIAEEAFTQIDALESRISEWRSDSQISRINNNAFEHPERVTPDVLVFLESALRIARDTGGAFDVTVGPLVDLWRTAGETGVLPSDAEIEATRRQMGFDGVLLDPAERSVMLAREGMRLNTGAIGKGLALDLAAEVVRSYGVEIALIEAGSSTYLALGAPPDSPGWTVRVRHPYNNVTVLDEVAFRDCAFSTSSNADSGVEIGGQRYGHILDPRTGRPAKGKLVAMSIAPTGTEADALSTAFFVMDQAAIERYCREHADTRAIITLEHDSGEAKAIRINFTD